MNNEKINIGNITTHSFWLFGQYFLTFIFLAVLLHIPFALLTWSLAAPAEVGSANELSVDWGPVIVIAVIVLIEGYLLQAIITVCVVRHLQQAPVTLGDAISVSLAAFVRIFLVSLLVTILMMLGFMLLVIPGIIIAIVLIVAMPVTIVEGLPVIDSLRRSRALTEGNRWRLFWILLVMFVILVIYSTVVTIIGEAAGLPETGLAPLLFEFLFLPANVLMSIAIAVSYHHLRIAKDGVDIKQLSAVFE